MSYSGSTAHRCHITQEYANPLVRPHLRSLPEKSDDMLGEAFQADRWRYEVDPDLACPMARAADGRDYFVNEAAIAMVGDSGELAAVMIRRWFTVHGAIHAIASPLVRTRDQSHLIVDGRDEKQLEIPLSSFRWCIHDMVGPNARAEMQSMPSPENISGMQAQHVTDSMSD